VTIVARTTAERLRLIAAQLAPETALSSTDDADAAVARLVAAGVTATSESAYLVRAVLDGAIPEPEEVVAAERLWRVEGLGELVRERLRAARWRRRPAVRVSNGILVDATDTGRTPYTTGIQRVARESIARWPLARIELVCWDRSRPRIHAATDEERALILSAAESAPAQEGGHGDEVVVPFHATYVLPEISVARHRYRGIRTVARHSGSRLVAVGFDCIAITTAEIAPPGMPAAFAQYLASLASFDEVVAISRAAAAEFEGWRRMLGGAGLPGPAVSVAELPFAVGDVDESVIEATKRELGLDPTLPVVVAVGSHEPRKNHVAFLHACELLWQQGAQFAVVMAGGASWDSDLFDDFVAELKQRGRPLTTVSRASDATIWALYRLARFSVFCSLNEGFGLPVAESLASGTPVVTSGFGSMRELAEGHGGVLADPREPRSIAEAMRVLLDDDAELARLAAETAALPRATWDDYAATLWRAIEGAAVSA